jgi:hypothetical protein
VHAKPAARRQSRWAADGPINGESFKAYVEQMLVPTLKPGDIVVMDNLGSHKSAAVRNAIRTAGARPGSAPLRLSGAASEACSIASHRTNALTTCEMPDRLQSNTKAQND